MLEKSEFQENFKKYSREYEEFKKYSNKEKDIEIQKKINEIVRYAAVNSKFYKKLYSNIDLNNDVDLEKLPIINKDSIKENFEDVVAYDDILKTQLKEYFKSSFDFEKRYLNKYLAFHTSGSTGNPAYIIWGEREFAITTASYYLKLMDLIKSKDLVNNDINRIAYIGIMDDYVGGNSWAYSMKSLVNLKMFSVFSPKEELYKGLNEFKPDLIMTKPSLLGELARKQRDGKINLNLKKIIFAGEMISPNDSRDIEDYFGVKASNSYSTCETGPIAFQFNESIEELSIFEDMVYVELVDDNGKRINEYYKEGNIVVTNLYNKTMPFIRYNLADRAFFIPNKVDNRLNRISYILGRGTSFFIFKDLDGKEIKVSEYPFWSLYVPGITRYQVIQKESSVLKIKIQWEENIKEEEKVLGAFNKKLYRILDGYKGLRESVKIEYETVSKINPNSAGKIQVTFHL